MLQNIYISNKYSFELYVHQRSGFSQIYYRFQHITMISEGSCDTGDWSNDAENSALLSHIKFSNIFK